MNSGDDIHDIDQLYRTYVQDLFAYASNLGFDKEVSKDAVHDIFCKICTDTRVLSGIENKRFYLLRALKNRLLDIYKQTRETTDLPEDDMLQELPFTIHVTVEDQMIQTEDKELIRSQIEELLMVLTDRQREIIYLRYSQELNYEEIAKLMQITVPGARKLFHKALTRLKQHGATPLVLFFLLP